MLSSKGIVDSSRGHTVKFAGIVSRILVVGADVLVTVGKTLNDGIVDFEGDSEEADEGTLEGEEVILIGIDEGVEVGTSVVGADVGGSV